MVIQLGFSFPPIPERRFSLGLCHLLLDYLYCGCLKHVLLNCLKPYLKPKPCKGWCRLCMYIRIIVIIDTFDWSVIYIQWNDILCYSPTAEYQNRIVTCTLSIYTSLNEKYIGCCLKDKVVNHLYYADDLVLVSPTASGMNELIQECESFSTEYGLKFNESKTVLLYFKPDNFKINPCTSIKMNGTLINVECSCKYLGHMITSKLSDNEDIKRQIRSFMAKLICYYAPSVNAHTM